MVGSNRNRRQRTQTKRYTDDNPSTFTTKGTKRELKREPLSTPVKKRQRPRERPERKSCQQPSVEPKHTSLSHHVSISHLFSNNERINSVVYGRGLGIPPSLKEPTWEQIPLVRCYFPQDVDKETGKSAPETRKISRSCTCLAVDDTGTYLAIGDTAGFVSIYTLHPKMLCLTLLSTSASIREHASELKLPPSKKYGLYEKKTHVNQILEISFSGKRLAVSTIQEIELLDAEQNRIIWSLSNSIPVQSLCIHPTTSQLLCSFASDTKMELISPLWSMCYDEDDAIAESVERTFVQPTIDHAKMSLGHRCAAIWDKSDLTRILMVTLVTKPDGDNRQDLLRLENISFKVLQRTTIPNKPAGKSSCHTVEYLSQSPSGHLTLVSSTRGIRLLDTSSFNLLQIFGENVALHGHSLLFQQCCFVPKSLLGNEVECLLEARENETIVEDSEWVVNQSCWVLGVPHARREPREMKEILHMWDFHDGKRTSCTILAPPKSDGFCSVIFAGGKLIVTTQTGDCYLMSPRVSSDFSGIMYPPGYKIIGENLEYIEDEDELDHVVKMLERNLQPEDGEGVHLDDMEMKVAMRLSMEDQRLKSETDEVDIMSVDKKENCLPLLTCRPEFCLKQSCQDGMSSATVDAREYTHGSFATSVLLPMPHVTHALSVQQSQTGNDESKNLMTKPLKAKRSKAASLEAMLKASLNQDLRKIMIARQRWGVGAGSILNQNNADVQRLEAECQGGERYSVFAKHTESIPVVSSSERSFADGSLDTSSSAKATTEESTTENYSNLVIVNDRTELGLGTEASSTYPGITLMKKGEVEQVKLDAAAALLMAASGVNNPSIRHLEKKPDENLQSSNPESQKCTLSRNSQKVCKACKGRWVFHICGKKMKPVDYDELLKAEQEKREKEEEEKRKVRAEKRRIADAKRRDARKKKKLEQEERIRQHEIERIRQEKQDREKAIERNRLHSEDKERRRAEMLQRLQAEQVAPAVSSVVDWPPPNNKSYNAAQNEGTDGFSSSSKKPLRHWNQSNEGMGSKHMQSSTFSTDWPPLASRHDVRNQAAEKESASSHAIDVKKQGSDKQMTLDKMPKIAVTTDTAFSYAGNNHVSSVMESNGLSQHFDSSDIKRFATSETLDPAQALASLASFASAAAPATVSEQENSRV
mmetsp:Transcript_17180/g.25394  ORF Transcript_17180/g.25394 Transcript_17180/m.25394 type:complete len:1158 (-) Transcript_17180:150-3623(-)